MIKQILSWLLTLISVFMVPYSFYMTALFQNSFHRILGLRIDPAYQGGTIAASFTDDFKDDYGAGSLVYPLHSSFIPGTLDILEYLVYQPQWDAPWSDEPHFWQLALTMATQSEQEKELIIRIYLDLTEGGSVEPLEEGQELASFDRAHPWDCVVEAVPREDRVLVYSHGGELLYELPLYRDSEDSRYLIRLPLEGPFLDILQGRPSYHYVFTGFYDEISRFQPLKRRASERNTGGAVSTRTCRIFDLITVEGYEQSQLLHMENPILSPISVGPLEVWEPRLSHGYENRDQQTVPAFANEENLEPSQPTDDEIQQWETALSQAGLALLDRGILLFKLDRHGEAKEILEPLMVDQEDPLALCYLGTIEAKLAASAAPLEAIDLVNRAYEYYRRALDIATTADIRAEILIHRGYVSRSIPESVFGKALEGARDFEQAAQLLEESQGVSPYLRKLYSLAAQCYDIAGSPDQVRIMQLKAESY